MSFKNTHASRYSFGWKTSTTSLADAGDTATVLSWDGGAAGDTLTLSGTFTAGSTSILGNSAAGAPASSTSAGSEGQFAWDSDYLYFYGSDSSWVVVSAFSLF
jgi:hypothetical protein